MQLAVEDYLMSGPDKENFKTYFIVAGGGQGATGQNAGQSFINLADFDRAPGQARIAPTRSSSAPAARSAAIATRRCSR